MTNGFGFQLAGCVLNNGSLTLDHVTVTGCLMTTDAGDFWQGGGGIYNGDGATLNLVDSRPSSNNTSGWAGGGVFSFFNTIDHGGAQHHQRQHRPQTSAVACDPSVTPRSSTAR